MITFKALNSSREDDKTSNIVPRELEIERLLSIVTECVKLQELGQMDEAQIKYNDIVRTRIFKEKLDPVADIHGSPIHAIQFVTCKNLGFILYSKGEVEEAISYWNKALILDETDISCLESLAKGMLEQGHLEDAYQYYLRLTNFVPLEAHKAKVMETMAMILFDLRFLNESIAIAQKVLRYNPESSPCLKIIELTKTDEKNSNKESVCVIGGNLPNLLLDEQSQPLVQKKRTDRQPEFKALVERTLAFQGKPTWTRLLEAIIEDLVRVAEGHDQYLGSLVAPVKIEVADIFEAYSQSSATPSAELETQTITVNSTQCSPNKRKTPPQNDENDISQRASGRTRTKRMTLTTADDVPVELQPLIFLDNMLPSSLSFQSESWSLPSQSELLQQSINKISANPTKRTRPRKADKFRQWDVIKELNIVDTPFSRNDQIILSAFRDSWNTGQYNTNNTILSLAGALLAVMIVGSHHSGSEARPLEMSQMNWTPPLKHAVITMVKLVESFSAGFLSRLSFQLGLSQSQEFEVFLFLSEILADEMAVMGCIFDPGQDYLECLGEESHNPMTSTTRQSLLDRFLSRIHEGIGQLSEKQRLRFEWVLVVPKLDSSSEAAIAALKEFEKMLQEVETTDIELPHCDAHPSISAVYIGSKKRQIESRLAIETAKSYIKAENYEGVYECLDAILNGSQEEFTQYSAADYYSLVHDYYTACMKLEKHNDALKRGIQLVHLAIGLFVSEPDGDDCLQSCAAILENLISMTCDTSFFLKDVFDTENEEIRFVTDLMILIHLGWYYYQNLSELSRSLNKTTIEKRTKMMPPVLIRSLVMFFDVMREKCQSIEAMEVEVKQGDTIADMISWLHTQLGEISLCGADDGRFLKYLVSYISNLDVSGYEPEMYQAYGCLYGINIRYRPDIPIMEHNTTSQPFTRKAAEDVIMTIKDDTFEKLNSQGYRSLTSDVRDCALKIETVFEEPPVQNARFVYNLGVVQRWLSQKIEVFVPDWSSFKKMPPTMAVFNLAPIYSSVYFFLGKIGWASYMLRQVYRQQQDLEKAAVQLQYHIALNPENAEGWYMLGQTYALMSEESLVVNAAYTSRRKGILDTQRKAYNAFLIASRLLARPSQHALLPNQSAFWLDFGNLCLLISLEPCRFDVFTVAKQANLDQLWQSFHELNKGAQVANTDTSLDTQKRLVLPFAAYCFKKALKVDHSNWYAHLQLAITQRKLGQSKSSVLEHFVAAIVHLPQDWISRENDRVYDPLYICFSFVLKSLMSKSLEPELATEAIKTVSEKCSILAKASSYILAVEERETIEGMNETPQYKQALIHAIECLNKVRALDKKRWHHKLTYRNAWIQYEIFKSPEKAKQEMMSLVSVKSSKSFKNIWKTEFERPGKHFFYFEKYVFFLFKLAWETKDLTTIRYLVKKSYKADDILPNPSQLHALVLEKLCSNEGRSHTSALPEDLQAWEKLKGYTEKTFPKVDWKSTDAIGSESIAERIGWFVLACELKRTYSPATKKLAWLDEFIAYRFAYLVLEGQRSQSTDNNILTSWNVEAVVSRALSATKSL